MTFALSGCVKRGNTVSAEEKSKKYSYAAEVYGELEFIEPESGEKTIVVEFNGKERTFNHEETFSMCRLDKVVSTYNGEKGAHLEIDDKTGEILVIFTAEYGSCDDAEMGLSVTEARRLADEFAKDYIKIDEYRVEYEGFSGKSKFTYLRYIDDYETMDKVSVYISDSGEVVAFCDNNMQEIGNLSYDGFDEEKAYEAARVAMIEKYPECYPESLYIEDGVFTVKDGKPAIVYYADIAKNVREDKDGEEKKYCDYELAQVVVTWG